MYVEKERGNYMDQTYMKEQPVLKLILSMALPMVLSMMVSSLYNIVDSFFIARISEDAMTALSLVYPVQNLVNAVMIGFGIGINAVISFYLGAQDKEMADRAATQGMLLGTIHGIGFMILGIVVMRPFLQMFTGNAQIVDYGVRYSRIAFLFATALSWQLVFEKTFQAVGRMVESMTCMMSGAVINIILDPVMIFGLGPFPKMGIEGAALATGIGQGMRPLLGYNYGAGEHKRVHKIFRDGLILVLVMMTVGTVICLAVPGQLMGLFTANPVTMQAGSVALRVISLGFIASSVSVICSGALEGLGKGVHSLIISLCRYVVVIIPAAFIVSRFMGAVGVWHAFWITEAVTAAISYMVYRKGVKG